MNDSVGAGSTSWLYDSAGRVRTENGPYPTDNVGYQYDSLNRLNQVQVQNGSTTNDTRALSYDSLSRVSSLRAAVGNLSIGTFGLVYQGQSDKLDRLDRPNGTQTQYTYEASGLKRLLGMQNRTNAGVNQSNFQSGFNYGSFRDNYSHVNRTYGGEATQTVTYSYTPTSMLKSEYGNAGTASNALVSKNYGFDAMGNRLQSKDMAAQVQVDSSYNGLNQLVSQSTSNFSGATPVTLSTTSYGFDGDGNQTSAVTQPVNGTASGTQYRYDDFSRLVSVEVPGASRQEFVYDGMSRLRISRSYEFQNGGWVQSAEKRRVYDGMDVVQERDVNNAVTASVTRGGNIGGILARTTPYHGDGLPNGVTHHENLLPNLRISRSFDCRQPTFAGG